MDDKAEIKNIKVEFIQSIEINESKQMVKSSPAFSKDQKYEPKIINKENKNVENSTENCEEHFIKESDETNVERQKENKIENVKDMESNSSFICEEHDNFSSDFSNIAVYNGSKKSLDEKLYPNDFDSTDVQISNKSKDLSSEKSHINELSDHNEKQYEEVEIIVEEIIEIEEESAEPIEIFDEIETIEIKHEEDNEEFSYQNSNLSESNEICDYSNEENFMEKEFVNSQSLKQFPQLKTYENRNKNKSQLKNNGIKKMSVNTVNSPILSLDKSVTTCIQKENANAATSFSNDSMDISYDSASNNSEDNAIKETNDSKGKIKIIKSQILNDTIDIKNLLKLKKTDKKNVKPVDICDNKSTSEENKIVNIIKNDEKLKTYEKQSPVIEKPKVMEKVLWKNVSIGNTRKLVPISTAVKIVKIPRNTKVFNVDKSNLLSKNISSINKPVKNYDSTTIITTHSNSPKISNQRKVYNYSENISDPCDAEFDKKNKFSNKNLKVYSSPKALVKTSEESVSRELHGKFPRNITEPRDKSKDDDKKTPVQKSLLSEQPDAESEITSDRHSNLKSNLSDALVENEKVNTSLENSVQLVKKRRGRPPKKETLSKSYQRNSSGDSENMMYSSDEEYLPENDRIGRVRKKSVNKIVTPGKRRGRPPKLKTNVHETYRKSNEESKSSLPKAFDDRTKDFEDESSVNNPNTEWGSLKSPTSELKKRGRPPKRMLSSLSIESSTEINTLEDLKSKEEDLEYKDSISTSDESQLPKKRRGRPPRIRKNVLSDGTETNTDSNIVDTDFKEEKRLELISKPTKRRGRPPQNKEKKFKGPPAQSEQKKPRGRPPQSAQKKRRGRPPKKLETSDLNKTDIKEEIEDSSELNKSGNKEEIDDSSDLNKNDINVEINYPFDLNKSENKEEIDNSSDLNKTDLKEEINDPFDLNKSEDKKEIDDSSDLNKTDLKEETEDTSDFNKADKKEGVLDPSDLNKTDNQEEIGDSKTMIKDSVTNEGAVECEQR